MTRAALVLAVRPMTRPARWSVPDPGERGHDVGLAGPGRGHQAVDQAAGGQQAEARLPLGVVQVRARQRRGRGLGADPLAHRQHRHVDQVLLIIAVLGGAEPFLGGRPVDARPVLAERQPRYVDDIRRRGDLQHVHALGAAGQGLVGQAVQVLLRVHVSGQRPEHLAELEDELRPVERGVDGLGRGDGLADDPGPLRFARHAARLMLRRVRFGCFVERGQRADPAPLRFARPRGHLLAGRRRVVILGVPRLQSGPLLDRPPGLLARSAAVVAHVICLELASAVPQFLAPGAERVDGLIADPADLDGHPVSPQHAAEADQLQLLGKEPVSQRP